MSQEIHLKYFRLYNLFIITYCFLQLIINVIHNSVQAFLVMFAFLYSVIAIDLIKANIILKIKLLFICSFIYIVVNNIFNFYTNSSAILGFLPFIFLIASTYNNKYTLLFIVLLILFYIYIPTIISFLKFKSFPHCPTKIFFNVLFVVFNLSFIAVYLKEKIEHFKNTRSDNENNTDYNFSPETSLIMQLKYKDLFAETEKLLTQNNLHLNNEISVKIIADKLNVAPLSISKAINFCTNDNFKAYINKKRIDFVKLSFEKDINKFTIQHIYTKAGFEQQSTFNRVFKEIVGQNPKEYILSIKENKIK